MVGYYLLPLILYAGMAEFLGAFNLIPNYQLNGILF